MKRMKKILAVGLAIALAIPSKVGAYTLKEEDSEYLIKDHIIMGVKPEGIEILDKYIVTDLQMLDDIVERSYNNDFNLKHYVIKTKTRDIDRFSYNEEGKSYDYWQEYLYSRGEVILQTTFEEEAILYDEVNDCYYHCITVNTCAGGTDWDRNEGIAHWQEYIDKVHEAEIEMGYVEGNNLCDYQLINQAYTWIRQNLSYGASPEYGYQGQTAIEGILYGKFVCAGDSRLINRLMHDFGIDSYWISTVSKPNTVGHAVNVVKLGDGYYGVDAMADPLQAIPNEYNNNNKQLYYRSTLLGLFSSFKGWNEGQSILHYNKSYKAATTYNWTGYPPLSEIIHDDNGIAYFEQQGAVDEYCDYCGKFHRYENTGILASKEGTETKEITDCYFDADKDHIDPWTLEEVDGSFTISINGKFNPDSYDFDDADVLYTEYWRDDPENKPIETTTGKTTVETEPATTPTVVESTPVELTSERVTKVPTTDNTAEATTSDKVSAKEEETTNAKKISNKKPKKVKLTNIKKRKIKVSWKKVKNAKKYEVQWSTSRKFKKSVKLKRTSKLSYLIKKVKKNKTYYIRVRGINGTKFGKWSSVKKIKIKN